MAIIWLKTDNFLFKVKGSLTFENITIFGGDMHISPNDCLYTPSPTICSCVSDLTTMNLQALYDSTSVCYINKPVVKENSEVYSGFIFLGNLEEGKFFFLKKIFSFLCFY